MSDKHFLTTKQLSRKVHRDRATIYRWLREGKGPEVTRLNGRLLFSKQAVEKFLKDSATE